MATKIKWSAHKHDSKVGTVEVIEDDHLAQRMVHTGQATFAPDDEPTDSGDAVEIAKFGEATPSRFFTPPSAPEADDE